MVNENRPQLWASPQFDGSLFTGRWTPARAGGEAIEPATGAQLARLGYATPADIFAAALRAGETYREEIVTWIMRESGSARAKAEFEFAVSLKAMRGAPPGYRS